MTKEEFIEECCIALQVDQSSLDEESSPETVESWDSMGWLSLIAMIDDKFNIVIEMKDLKDLKKIGDFVDLLVEKGLIK